VILTYRDCDLLIRVLNSVTDAEAENRRRYEGHRDKLEPVITLNSIEQLDVRRPRARAPRIEG
jgi:hypothetical protein